MALDIYYDLLKTGAPRKVDNDMFEADDPERVFIDKVTSVSSASELAAMLVDLKSSMYFKVKKDALEL